MRLITLNIWGGKEFSPLMEFFDREKNQIDIFCLQEMLFGLEPGFTKENKMRVNISAEITKKLHNFRGYKFPAKHSNYFATELLPQGVELGQEIFVRKSMKVISNGGFRTYPKERYISNHLEFPDCGDFQYIKIEEVGNELIIGNLHGLWQENSQKLDTPERMEQSKIIRDFFDKERGRKIILGDFNMRPEIQSMKILENGMDNLIAKYGIKSTRSSLYPKPIRFSDYILTSLDIKVMDFKVLRDVVSDHLPLLMEFE